jgi:hypothetical protein
VATLSKGSVAKYMKELEQLRRVLLKEVEEEEEEEEE